MMMNLIILLLLGLSAAVWAEDEQDFSDGLTGLGGAQVAAQSNDWQARQQATERAAEIAAAMPATQGDPARLGAGDKVKVTVFGEDDLSGSFDIDNTGSLAMPLIGGVTAGGLTPHELGEKITRLLARGYLVHPRVNVEVMTFRPFFILGEVNKPGSYAYSPDMRIISAVALAGGYTPRAKTSKIEVRRANDPAHKDMVVGEDAKLYPGDVVRVNERFF